MRQSIKRTAAGILAAAMVVSAGSTDVFAAGQGSRYIDSDGDGICDNRGGISTTQNISVRSVRKFIDADNDGICDNYGTNAGGGTRGGGTKGGGGHGGGARGGRNR